MFGLGKYSARLAVGEEDTRRCQRLRYMTFRAGAGTGPGLSAEAGREGYADGALDADEFDPHCWHMMVEECRTGTLVCCFRMQVFESGARIGESYSAKYYELSALTEYPGKMLEMGRFCIHPGYRDPNILRVAWSAMSDFVERENIELLFGCSSFSGVDDTPYSDAFALLKEKHLAPKRWLPRVKAPKVFRFAKALRLKKPDLKLAMRRMPPLLRTYLVMGGWVSDHAVIDNDLNTLHVFTGVEVQRVPKARAKLLRRRGAAGA
ncbi:MAG: GNAT family N-acyltransferase [Pseudomonadota bacterium]